MLVTATEVEQASLVACRLGLWMCAVMSKHLHVRRINTVATT